MNKVVYFKENSGGRLEMAINQFAECHEILQVSYNNPCSGHHCMVLYKDFDICPMCEDCPDNCPLDKN